MDLSATQAAIRAGYSSRTAHQIGYQLLKNPAVAAAVEAGRKSLTIQTGITRERVLKELAAVAISDIRKLYDENGNLRPVHQLDDDTAASIAGIETDELWDGSGEDRAQIGVTRKVKRFDKTKALEMLGRHFGLWKDPEAPPPEGPSLTVVVEQRVVAGPGVVANQVVVNLAPPERA